MSLQQTDSKLSVCPEDGEIVQDEDCANCGIPCDSEIEKRAEIEAKELQDEDRRL